jgi:hypothetical protein
MWRVWALVRSQILGAIEMTMMPIAISHYLVPEVKPVAPEGFTVIETSISQGLPHVIQLGQGTQLVVMIPTGLGVTWRDADSMLVVSRSEDQLSRLASRLAEPIGNVGRASARMLLQIDGTTVGSIPFVVGSRWWIADSGQSGQGVRIELSLISWTIQAGSMRGPGEFGSKITLAWRKADQAIERFSTPPQNPHFIERTPPVVEMKDGMVRIYRMESVLGLKFAMTQPRFMKRKVLMR